MINVLLIEDDRVDEKAFVRAVREADLPYTVSVARSFTEAKHLLSSSSFDIILADYWLGDGTSLELFDGMRGTPFILLTGTGDEVTAVKVMKAGASDYVIKDPERRYLKTLPVAVQNALKHRQAETDLRESQMKLLEAKEAAEVAARVKAEFLANVSHELRTPLNVIVGMTNLLLESALSDKQREFSDIVRQAGDSLLALVNDILDFSKTESGKMTLEVIDVNVHELLNSVVSILGPVASEKGIVLRAEFDPNLPPAIKGDPLRLRQILTNLTSNAIKFSERGEVFIRVDVSNMAGRGPAFRCEVKDSGIGIEQEDLNRLFHSFTQADNSTTRKYGGSGLGLAISKQLVELMQGQIGAESRSGKGSTFWFEIPLKEGDLKKTIQPGSPASYTPNPALQGVRILVAEDNKFNQALIINQLSRFGMDVQLAANGRLALEALEKCDFALVLMDCQMPEMDGYQATCELRRREAGRRHTPVIAMTANAMDGDRERCLDAKMDDYVAKPVKINKLQEVLLKWIPQSPAKEPCSLTPVDMSILLEVSGADPSGLNYLIQCHLEQSRKSLCDLEQAINSHSVFDIRRVAHGLIGSSSSFGAQRIIPPLKELESVTKRGEFPKNAKELLIQIKDEFGRIEQYLESVLQRQAA